MNILYEALFVIISYLFGSIPSGLIIGKIFRNVDIREYGSGNLGATNAVRVLGLPLGVIVGIMDIMKGGAVILIAKNFFSNNSFYITHIPTIIFGVVAVLGHIYPVFAKFRGGKAVATSAGVLLFAAYPIFLVGLVSFIVTLIITKYVSLASTVVAISVFLASVISYIFRNDPALQGFDFNIFFLITATLLFLFIIWRHIPNYKRLLKGTEKKVSEWYNKK